MRTGVLCAGRLYCDLIFTGVAKNLAPGEEQFASGLNIAAGGGAYITAAHLASLGRAVSLLATIPAKPFDTVVLHELGNTEIDANYCMQALEGCDPQITVAISQDEERSFLTRRSGTSLPVESIDWSTLPDIMHLHIGEIATLLDYPSLVDDAHAAGVSVSVDCSWDDEMFTRSDLVDVLGNVDVFLPNQSEFDQLSKQDISISEKTVCVIKQGAAGATVIHDGARISEPAVPVDVVDTTGAGDAFNAGFIHGWLNKLDLLSCLKLGCECGAKAVSRIGGATNL